MGKLKEIKVKTGLWKGKYTFTTRRKHKKAKTYRFKATQNAIKINNNQYRIIMKGKRWTNKK